jgi:hypothetical protein
VLAQNFLLKNSPSQRAAAYMYIPGTSGRGKLSNNFQEKKLGTSANMLNFKYPE